MIVCLVKTKAAMGYPSPLCGFVLSAPESTAAQQATDSADDHVAI